MRGTAHVRFGSAGRGNGRSERSTPRPGPILTPRLRSRQTSRVRPHRHFRAMPHVDMHARSGALPPPRCRATRALRIGSRGGRRSATAVLAGGYVPLGGMLALNRKKLVGSYLALSAVRRAHGSAL